MQVRTCFMQCGGTCNSLVFYFRQYREIMLEEMRNVWIFL